MATLRIVKDNMRQHMPQGSETQGGKELKAGLEGWHL